MSNNIQALDIQKPKRTFISDTLTLQAWDQLQSYFDQLLERKINSLDDLQKWLHDRSELDSFLEEEGGWRYIRMTCDTSNEKNKEAYNFFITEVEPKIAPLDNELNKKLMESPYRQQLPESYAIHIRDIQKKIEIFREENIPLNTEVQQLSQKYGEIAGAMSINWNGEELTLQQAAKLIKDQNREIREKAYKKIWDRRLENKNELDELYTKLIKLRHQIAINAGFSNFRDYMFAALGRFDYTPDDCVNFQNSIKALVPIIGQFDRERRDALMLEDLRPWDRDVDISGKPALKPFNTGEELLDKAISSFAKVDPYVAQCLATLKALKHVDLDSRIGKAPGGYNYPLYESNVPFIFMNASGTLQDLVTMVHEGGHAVHSIQVKDLPYVGLKSTPSEVAELASMSMELLSMDYWQDFFPSEDDLKRAQKEHLEDILTILPWIASIDKFQHWVYTNPEHTLDERHTAWRQIFGEYSSKELNWTGIEDYFVNFWQKQLHLFEVPFYYIEYGMAQLGAIALWRNYKSNKDQSIKQYLAALKLGYTKSIGEIYRTAGIQFDFKTEYVNELIDFVKLELAKLG